MQLPQRNKAITFSSDRVARAVELRTVEHELSGDEQNEVGVAVALAAENAAKSPWHQAVSDLMRPTEDEQAALDEAGAAYALERQKSNQLWAEAQRLDATATADAISGRADVNSSAKATDAVIKARHVAEAQATEVERASADCARALAAHRTAANARKRAFVAKAK